MKKRAVVLLSGGLDSATTLYIAKSKGYECHALIFEYGQRHRRELSSAKRIARGAGCEYWVIKVEMPWQGSSLLDKSMALPKKRPMEKIKSGIPSSYVPARNTIFLSFAASYAEAIGAKSIFIGANAIDYSGYPDCREVYLKAFGRVIKEGTKAGVEGRAVSIEAPLLKKTKAQIIKEGNRLGAPYGDTWSCYEGKGAPCGMCDSCVIRKNGFKEAGVVDPLVRI